MYILVKLKQKQNHIHLGQAGTITEAKTTYVLIKMKPLQKQGIYIYINQDETMLEAKTTYILIKLKP